MRKLLDADLLDIVPTDNGFIYLTYETKPNGKESGVFYSYNQTEEIIEPSDITDYIDYKFGFENGRETAQLLGDFVNCRISALPENGTIAFYDNGSYKIVRNGKLTEINELIVLDSPARSPVADGKDLWLALPEANAVINYSLEYGRVEMRVGSPTTKAFCKPVDLKIYNNNLYICNEFSYKIRCLDLIKFTVKDYRVFNEEIKMYFRSGENEYAVLKSGIYLI